MQHAIEHILIRGWVDLTGVAKESGVQLSQRNKHRCAQPRRKEIVTTDDRCNHWPFTLLTIHPLFTETTVRQTDISTIVTLLLYPCMVKLLKNSDWPALPYTLSLVSDWSACAHTYHTLPAPWLVSLNGPIQPSQISDWSVWMSTYFCVNEPITMVKFNGKSTKLQTDRQTDIHTYTLTSTVLSPPFSAGNNS